MVRVYQGILIKVFFSRKTSTFSPTDYYNLKLLSIMASPNTPTLNIPSLSPPAQFDQASSSSSLSSPICEQSDLPKIFQTPVRLALHPQNQEVSFNMHPRIPYQFLSSRITNSRAMRPQCHSIRFPSILCPCLAHGSSHPSFTMDTQSHLTGSCHWTSCVQHPNGRVRAHSS